MGGDRNRHRESAGVCLDYMYTVRLGGDDDFRDDQEIPIEHTRRRKDQRIKEVRERGADGGDIWDKDELRREDWHMMRVKKKNGVWVVENVRLRDGGVCVRCGERVMLVSKSPKPRCGCGGVPWVRGSSRVVIERRGYEAQSAGTKSAPCFEVARQKKMF